MKVDFNEYGWLSIESESYTENVALDAWLRGAQKTSIVSIEIKRFGPPNVERGPDPNFERDKPARVLTLDDFISLVNCDKPPLTLTDSATGERIIVGKELYPEFGICLRRMDMSRWSQEPKETNP